MALNAGTLIGPYEIVAAIGAGGMGEVFRARDVRLKRDVALKILPESFASDPDRLARFQREAEVLASLNHPNIAGIYGLEESDGTRTLVMELVEGDDLSQRIRRGPIPIEEALPIAKQIAEALEAAHEQGIIHRDLKPANIKVRDDGAVKVLDFGLAKLAEPSAVAATNPSSLSLSPTITSPALMTGVGVLLGTAAYMSPEQAKGRAADKRSDIWAFGCVLYEMLTGARAFAGDDVSDTLVAVLRDVPEWSALPTGIPREILTLLRHCLEKDRKRRLDSAAVARVEIEDAMTVRTTGASATPATREARRWIVEAMLVIALLAVAIPAARHLLEAPPPLAPELRTDIVTPATTDPFSFALSPDGRQFVFVASGDGPSRLWLRPLAVTTSQPLAGTEGATYPFWSPDSRSVAFFSDGKLKRLDIGEGLPRTLANADDGRGGAWSPDGIILFKPNSASSSGLFRVPASGGEASEIGRLAPRQYDHRFPQFLPGGRQFLFYVRGAGDVQGIFLGSLDSAETKRLTVADSPGAYAPPGWLLFVRQGTLFEQRFNPSRGELAGDPIVIADQVGYDATTFPAGFSVSSAGQIAYRSGGADGGRQLTWFDRSGKALGVAAPPDSTVTAPELSPDGSRVAIDRATIEGNRDVWLMDVTRGGLVRFTFDPTPDGFPVWSPDGSRIAFESLRKGSWDIWVKPSSGVGVEELLLNTPNNEFPLSWSRDGRFLLFAQDGAQTRADLWALPMTGNDRKPIAIANTPFVERVGEFSPDGRWVAYETDESGRFEIVVQPFPNPTGKWQVSTGGGVKPRWLADGRELYYLAPDGRLMAVAVTTQGSAFRAGTPVALFPTHVATSGTSTTKAQYAVSGDGRFLINQTTGQAAVAPITLLLNWQPEAKK